MENSCPCIRGPPGTDHSALEKEALDRIDESLKKTAPMAARTAKPPPLTASADFVREAAKKTSRMRKTVGQVKRHVDGRGAPLGISTRGVFVKEQEIDFDDVIAMMKKVAKKPWQWCEDKEKFYLYRFVFHQSSRGLGNIFLIFLKEN